jgi:hypothetical protein
MNLGITIKTRSQLNWKVKKILNQIGKAIGFFTIEDKLI